MTAQDILNDVRMRAAEWLEMSENPDAMVSGILAKHIEQLNSYIDYLEKRVVNYDSGFEHATGVAGMARIEKNKNHGNGCTCHFRDVAVEKQGAALQ